MGAPTFFNLPQEASLDRQAAFFGKPEKHTVETNWHTFADQPLNSRSFVDVLANKTPVVREKAFLTQDECDKMLKIVQTHSLVRILSIENMRLGLTCVLGKGSIR
jgi:hypothetical protein